MGVRKKPNGYWTEGRVVSEVKKLTSNRKVTITQLRRERCDLYDATRKLGITDKIKDYLIKPQKPKGYWTEERVMSDIKELSHQQQITSSWLRKNHNALYIAVLKLGVLDKVRQLLSEGKKQNGYWTEDRIIATVKDLASNQEITATWLNKNHGSLYNTAIKLGILDKVKKHLTDIQKPLGYWTEDRIIATVKDLASNQEITATWLNKNHGSLYNTACSLGILGKIKPYLTQQVTPSNQCYILLAQGYSTDIGYALVKFGITNNVDKRLNELQRVVPSELTLTVHRYREVADCRSIEKQLLQLGELYDFGEKFDGSTEYRLVDADQLVEAIGLLEEAPTPLMEAA